MPCAAPAKPTPGDMIDYAGVKAGRLDMGFAYDDIPYGRIPDVTASPPPLATALQTFADRGQPLSARIAAVESAKGGALAADELTAVLALASDASQPEAMRLEALKLLSQVTGDGRAVRPALEILKAGQSAALEVAAVETLSMQMMFGALEHHAHHEIMTALRTALSSRHAAVRVAALRSLAAHKDPMLVDKLVSVLQQPAGQPISGRGCHSWHHGCRRSTAACGGAQALSGRPAPGCEGGSCRSASRRPAKPCGDRRASQGLHST